MVDPTDCSFWPISCFEKVEMEMGRRGIRRKIVAKKVTDTLK
jgi:hypothetical protein